MNIIGLFPLSGNGGIASWAKQFLDTFPNDIYNLYPIDVSPSQRGKSDSLVHRCFSGIRALHRIRRELLTTINNTNIDILHTTTSGNLGSYRDIQVAKICRRHGIKTILHCHYGCLTEDLNSQSIVGKLLNRAMNLYDQIWVLDKRTYNTLKERPQFASKVFLTPNPIRVDEKISYKPKSYNTVAYIGNLLPTKGIYELVEACIRANVRLDIIGPGSNDVVNRIKAIAHDRVNNLVFLHGRLENEHAIKLMNNSDIVALPTYYKSEAFPISIIEAMSMSKLVISCPRAAIQDMLTGLDGALCGVLVGPQSVDDIVDAINWCQANPEEADIMCKRAYEKAYTSYRREVVYDIYSENYRRLFES